MAFVKSLSTMRSGSGGNTRQIGDNHHQHSQHHHKHNHSHSHKQLTSTSADSSHGSTVSGRGFKGLLTRSHRHPSSGDSSTTATTRSQQQQLQQQQQLPQPQPQQRSFSTGAVSSSYIAHPQLHTTAHEVADDFLPNPRIPDSPNNTPTRKTWEKGYLNFLSRGTKSGSPNTVSSDLSSKSPELSKVAPVGTSSSSAAAGGTFSVLPGSKRLVTRHHNQNQHQHLPTTPQSVPDTHRSVLHASEFNSKPLPSMPNLVSAGQHLTENIGPSSSSSDLSKKSSSGGNGNEGETAIRGGKFFKAVFPRSRSDRAFATKSCERDELDTRRSRSYTGDELDSCLRRGEGKGTYTPFVSSAAITTNDRVHSRGSLASAFLSLDEEKPVTIDDDDEDADDDDDADAIGLDSLLASASSSPHNAFHHHHSVPNGIQRCSSTGMIHHPMSSVAIQNAAAMYQQPQQRAYELTRRTISASDVPSRQHYHHYGIVVDPAPSTDNNDAMEPQHDQQQYPVPVPLPPPQPFNPTALPQQQEGGIGSLLTQQFSNYDELDVRQHQNQQPPHQVYHKHTTSSSNISGLGDSFNDNYSNQAITIMQPPETLDIFLQDPSFTVDSSPSSLLTPSHQQRQLIMDAAADPSLKKAFTEFHNASRFGDDATSAFLGDEPSLRLHHDSYVSYHLMMMRGGGSSVPYYHESMSERHYKEQINVSTSLPLETVDENSISIHKSMRLLKPVQGTDSWEQGRRYLIAPAAIAACPLTVVNKLSGEMIQTAPEAAASPKGFGTIDLGECLITYVGEKHHLSLGKWSSCRLVLRQNYLLEYDCNAPKTSLPRGFCHLEHAIASKHADFQDSFELNFYASPCAKADQRVLMVRVLNREERDDWITCINRAAKLRMTDLWDFDTSLEIGRGRYASIFPARRKSESDDEGYKSLQNCECALKVVDKNQFWRRVVKGKERADTLVREPSVQSTLTAKCGKIPSFLQLRSFFETSDNVVMELELLKGTDLFDHISENGVLSEKEAAEIISDILVSLEAMNRVGLAHRDVKPANILMCDKERDGASVKLGDFGMSTFVGVDGMVRGRCGTPGYVAPEILTAGSRVGYSNRVDVFSAGVTLYVMLCGYEPFYGETEKELIEANKAAKIEFTESEWSGISEEARDLVSKMTAFDPRERLSTKEALQHPWIRRHVAAVVNDNNNNNDSSPTSSFLHGGSLNTKNLALSSSDLPSEGACVIS